MKKMLAKWAAKRLSRTLTNMLNKRLDEAPPEARGTAAKPLVLTQTYDSLLDPNAFDLVHVDHVHTSDAVCVKNRFGPRCYSVPRESDWKRDDEDYGANSIFGMG